MKRLVLALAVLLQLSATVLAKDVYQIRTLNEDELLSTYDTLLRDACRFSDREWHDWPVDPHAGYWGDGVSTGNEGIRGISNMVFTSGVLLKYSPDLAAEERDHLLSKVKSAIRYVVATHKTGTQKCVDGKQWGAEWQSAYWAGTTAFGALLVWDQLEPQLQQGMERVVSSEADRFLNTKPPTQFELDTKAEENGWNLLCISAAANMFPKHPHAAAWNEKAIEYMMNTLSVPSDLKDDTIVDGRPVRQWVVGANLYPEFVLENHAIFHPAYLECSTYFLTQSTMHFVYAGHKIPQAAGHHLQDTWQVLQTIMLPSGESAFPQGMDWELHGLPDINLVASLATYKKDPLAAGMEQIILQRIRTWQQSQKGDLAVPGSRLGYTRHSIVAEQLAYGYLAHKLFGRAPTEVTTIGKSAPRLAGVHDYQSIGVTMHRTADKFFSLSWKNRIMGMLVPIGGGHDNNPHFTFPIHEGLVGSFELRGGGESKPIAVEHTWKATSNGFETSGTLASDGDRLKQSIRIDSIGDKIVVYQDHLIATTDVSVKQELGTPIGIENDELSGGERTIYHAEGEMTVGWKQPPREISIPGSWANIDGRLAVVAVTGSGLTYKKANGYNGQAVCADVLYGSFSDRHKDFKVGNEVAQRLIVFATEITPNETAALARSIKMDDSPGGKLLRLTLPAGEQVSVPLQ